jgi:hypothetical protein
MDERCDSGSVDANSFALGLGADGANWKAMNSYCVDGGVYMFITRCHYPYLPNGDLRNRHVWRNSSIIKSIDQGLT